MNGGMDREPDGYEQLFRDVKQRIREGQIRAATSVNRELVILYWTIGRMILEKQKDHGWGAKVIDRLSLDLKKAFPDQRGLSTRNLKYMRSFGEAYNDLSFVQQAAASIPWYHNCIIMDKIKDKSIREFYIQMTVESGWSRNVLELQIQSRLHNRQGMAITNFSKTLPHIQSDLAQQVLKDPYTFEFLAIEGDAREREIHKALVDQLKNFLMGLGMGFAYVGSQVKLEVGDDDFYIDLLFYHLKLRCFVAVELKAGRFKPEFVGKMNFYLSAVDERFSHETDNQAIGILLCRDRSKTVAEYSLRRINTPMGISTYDMGLDIPQKLQDNLPSKETLELELNRNLNKN